ncbi:hypothetical protein Tco_1496475, partial [Tanacetum coccineum]
VSNDDAAVAQRRLEDKQLEEKTNTDCLVKEQEKVHLGIKVGANITVTGVPEQEGADGNVAGKKKVKESMKANLEKLLKFVGLIYSTFEVEPHGNVDHVAGSQKVQTQDLIHYHSTHDREQHLAWELFSYREDSNEAAFAVAAVEKIYAHESLTFNNTVACELIFKWKVGLKDDMDSRSDVYLLSNGCKKCSDDSDGYYWEYTPDFVGGTLHTVVDLQTDVQVFVNFDYAMGYMTLTEVAKEAIWLKGLATESGFELKMVAGIATCALSKAIPGPRFQHRLKLLCIEDF